MRILQCSGLRSIYAMAVSSEFGRDGFRGRKSCLSDEIRVSFSSNRQVVNNSGTGTSFGLSGGDSVFCAQSVTGTLLQRDKRWKWEHRDSVIENKQVDLKHDDGGMCVLVACEVAEGKCTRALSSITTMLACMYLSGGIAYIAGLEDVCVIFTSLFVSNNSWNAYTGKATRVPVMSDRSLRNCGSRKTGILITNVISILLPVLYHSPRHCCEPSQLFLTYVDVRLCHQKCRAARHHDSVSPRSTH